MELELELELELDWLVVVVGLLEVEEEVWEEEDDAVQGKPC